MLTGSGKRSLSYIHGDHMLYFSAFDQANRDESMIRPNICHISFCNLRCLCSDPF